MGKGCEMNMIKLRRCPGDCNNRKAALLLLLSIVAGTIPKTSLAISCKVSKDSAVSEIPAEWINDNYCDCPLDGLDEPHTSACSGSVVGGWAGITSKYYYANDMKDNVKYTCPQQPKIKLPPSKIWDGICDCCDGSDELRTTTTTTSPCKNICEEVLKEERLQQERLQLEFTQGYMLRRSSLEEFSKIRNETLAQLEILENQMRQIDLSLRETSDLLSQHLASERARKQQQLFSTTLPFLNALSMEEMYELMVAVCYVAAGHEKLPKDPHEFYYNLNNFISSTHDTCKPLFKALFDMGYACDWVQVKQQQSDEQERKDDAQYKVQCQLDTKIYDMLEYQENKQPRERAKSTDDHVFPFDASASVIAPFHQHFYNQATFILEQIEKIYEQEPKDDDDVDDDTIDRNGDRNDLEKEEEDRERRHEGNINDEGQQQQQPKETNVTEQTAAINIDPMAVHTVKIELKDRLRKINDSIRCAQQAMAIQIDSPKDASSSDDSTTAGQAGNTDKEQMAALAVSLLWHSHISSENLVDILYMVLPEFDISTSTEQVKSDSTVCESGKSTDQLLCPPPPPIKRTITPPGMEGNDERVAATGSAIEIPPTSFYTAAVERCEVRRKTAAGKLAHVAACSLPESGENSAPLSIPSNVPDGYLGYYQFVPRREDDSLHQTLSPLNDTKFMFLIEGARATIMELQAKKQTVQQEMNQLQEKIGGRDWKFGTDGILFPLNERCYELTAGGKYTYEICPFGNAYQRDKGSPSSSGTSLGTWKVSYVVYDVDFIRFNPSKGITLTHFLNCYYCNTSIFRELSFMKRMV